MKFKHHPSYRLPYATQGLIYFVCQNASTMSPETQEYIRNLCSIVCGEYNESLREALYEAVTTGDSMQRTAITHNVDVSTLCRYVQIFYRKFRFDEVS